MGEFFHALHVFANELASVGWIPLAIALACHGVKLVVRAIAWRNILRASYPEQRIPRRPVLGAYVAGVGINSIVPGPFLTDISKAWDLDDFNRRAKDGFALGRGGEPQDRKSVV